MTLFTMTLIKIVSVIFKYLNKYVDELEFKKYKKDFRGVIVVDLYNDTYVSSNDTYLFILF